MMAQQEQRSRCRLRPRALLLVVMFACIGASSSGTGPFSSPSQTEDDAMSELDVAMNRRRPAQGVQTPSLGQQCAAIGTVMSRGWWPFVGKLISACAEKDIKVETEVHRAVSSIRAQLAKVTKQLQGTVMSTISPSFQWAQSLGHIYLSVKFAHKWDTPATLGVEQDAVNITSAGVFFQGTSATTSKRFQLSLKFKQPIDPDGSTFSFAAVGRASFTFKKAKRAVWPRLLKTKKSPKNMHVWWAMQEKYESEIDDADSILAKEEEERKAKEPNATESTNGTDTTAGEEGGDAQPAVEGETGGESTLPAEAEAEADSSAPAADVDVSAGEAAAAAAEAAPAPAGTEDLVGAALEDPGTLNAIEAMEAALGDADNTVEDPATVKVIEDMQTEAEERIAEIKSFCDKSKKDVKKEYQKAKKDAEKAAAAAKKDAKKKRKDLQDVANQQIAKLQAELDKKIEDMGGLPPSLQKKKEEEEEQKKAKKEEEERAKAAAASDVVPPAAASDANAAATDTAVGVAAAAASVADPAAAERAAIEAEEAAMAEPPALPPLGGPSSRVKREL